eukprot:TRINITY_DN843_c1_g1_i1.p1 TRINITY_DN843_c1_g1~~TRINITY_DN843_c1_g1_i1.p1  ORF type:complete len:561 (-),score=132.05 TRINITY_DN843_c1_g1_i1:729-2375(-)
MNSLSILTTKNKTCRSVLSTKRNAVALNFERTLMRHQRRSYAVNNNQKNDDGFDAAKKSQERRIVGGDDLDSLSLTELRNAYQSANTRLSAIRDKIVKYRDTNKHTILFLGAGRSSTVAIDYFLKHAEKENWLLRVGDFDESLAKEKCGNSPHAVAFKFDVNDPVQRKEEISKASIVISLLPIHLHSIVAKDCVEIGKSMITASYLSPEMKALNEEAKKKGLLLLNEMGVDPGIDHMSCMQSVEEIRSLGGDITRVETITGGLISPSCANNPWNYKFTWFPRNVVLAGQGGVKFLHHGENKYIPYHNLFSRTERLNIDGIALEAYANRDSLSYRELYDLQEAQTFFRGTLRNDGFCSGWDILVKLGLTDNSFEIDCDGMTYRQFTDSFLFHRQNDSVELKLAYFFGFSVDSPEMHKLRWLGLFDERPITIKRGTPAMILLSLLEKKWEMKPEDKDMIVMLNKFHYFDPSGTKNYYTSTLVLEGENATRSAMAKTVGLPCATAAHLYLKGELPLTGVHIPTIPEIYKPVMNKLKDEGIVFKTEIHKQHH